MPMRDTITFTADRRGDEIVVVCTRSGPAGDTVIMRMDPGALFDNLHAQMNWLREVEHAQRTLDVFRKAGAHGEEPWLIVDALLPSPLERPTSVRPSAQCGADLDDELFQCGDDGLGEPDD